jgi:8-oxo-dGTP diphosphatase
MKRMLEVACAVIMKGDKLLITRRSVDMSHPQKWEFPGGKLKTGESPEQCIHREIKEELHAAVAIEQLLPNVNYDYGDKRVKLIPFVCRLVTEDISLTQHSEFAWVDKSVVEHYDLLPPDVEILNGLMAQWQ